MTDVKETDPGVTPPAETEKGPPQTYEGPAVDYHGDPPRPRGWMYKSFRSGSFFIPWYASPRIQLGMVSFVCFMCPGMFNALSGLGGGGREDPELAADMVMSFISARVGLALTFDSCRTPPSTPSSPSLASWQAPLSIGLVFGFPSPLVVLDTVSTQLACSFPCMQRWTGSTFSPVPSWVFALVSCGPHKDASCCRTLQKRRRGGILHGFGPFSILVVAWEAWYAYGPY